MGNRGFFADGGDVVALNAVPDARSIATHADFCRPFHETGAVVESVRERLAARAATLGWTLADSPLAGLHLVVDGERLEPHVCGLSVRFIVPATATSVWMVSDTTIPSDLWAGCRGDILLCVDLTRPALPRWIEPVRSIGDERLALAS